MKFQEPRLQQKVAAVEGKGSHCSTYALSFLQVPGVSVSSHLSIALSHLPSVEAVQQY